MKTAATLLVMCIWNLLRVLLCQPLAALSPDSPQPRTVRETALPHPPKVFRIRRGRPVLVCWITLRARLDRHSLLLKKPPLTLLRPSAPFLPLLLPNPAHKT